MSKYQIALDVGATKILGGLIVDNKIIKKTKRNTLAKNKKERIIANIKNTIHELWLPGVKEIGIGLAGQIDFHTGEIISTTNFNHKFTHINLKEILQHEFKIPVLVDNDVKCLGLAENNYGIGKNYKNFIALTVGTGIGGALIFNHELYRGQDNLAGEFGHMCICGKWIGPAPLCGCGKKYCWETLASGRAWQKIAKKHSSSMADKIIIPNLVIGLYNLASIFNPQSFILGGGLLDHPKMLENIKKEFYLHTHTGVYRKIKFHKPALSDNAILLGSLIKK